MTVKKKEVNIFLVQSHTNKDLWYEVNLVTRYCSCPHFKLHLIYFNGNKTCKHYDDVIHFLNTIEKTNEVLFLEIERIIKEAKNYIPWEVINNKYDDEVIEEMLQLDRLIQLKPGFLSVLE